MRHCPYCAEEIQDAAIVCKHCRRDLPQPAPVIDRSKLSGRDLLVPPVRKPVNVFKWVGGLFVAVCVVGFTAVYFVADSARFDKFKEKRAALHQRCDERIRQGRAADPEAYDACERAYEAMMAEAKREGWAR